MMIRPYTGKMRHVPAGCRKLLPAGIVSVCSGASTRHQRGQAIVEFALLLPVLLLITLGVIDFGRGLHAYVALAGAARDGARVGTLYPSTIETASVRELRIINTTRNAAASAFVTPGSVAVTLCQIQNTVTAPNTCIGYYSAEPARPNAALRVTASYNFNLIIGSLFGNMTVPLTASAQMSFD